MPNRGARTKLLFLCQTLPFPPDGGVNIRAYHILRLLAAEFDVVTLCFFRRAVRRSPREVAASIDGLRQFGPVEAFPIPQEHNRLRWSADHARSLVAGRAYTIDAYESGGFRSRVREVLAGGAFGLVHADSIDLAGYFGAFGQVPWVLTHHNVESQLLARRAERESSWARRWYVHRQAVLTARLEREWCRRAPLNVAVSDADAAALRAAAPGAEVMVVPNGVDVDTFRPSTADGRGVVFVGGTTWFPNRDALEYFSTAILPLVPAEKRPPITWVGRCTDEERAQYAGLGVTLTGYVDDIRPFVHQAACFVVPLRVGGGTRLKILDAWAMGKAVVSTSVGCEGLEAVDGENIIIRDDPREFAQAVYSVLADGALRTRLERNARATAERRYSWKVIGEPMIRRYRALAGPAPEGGTR